MAIGHGNPVGQVYSFYIPTIAAAAAVAVVGLDFSVQSSWMPRAAQAVPTQATTFAVPPNPPAPPMGWHQALSGAPPVAKAQQGYSFVPFNTLQVALAAPQGWYAPLSVTVKAAPAVYEDTAQFAAPVTVPVSGWKLPLSVVPTKLPVHAGFVWTPPGPVPTVPPIGWYRTAANWGVAAPRAKAQQGYLFTPFALAPPVTPLPLVYDVGTEYVRSTYYQALVQAFPPTAPPAPAIGAMSWQQPLSGASKTAVASPTQATTFAVPPSVAAVVPPYGWAQALSGAPLVARAQQGYFFVPFNTVQVTVVPLQGWYQPLAIAPTRDFVNFSDIISPSPPVGVPSGWQAPLAGAAPAVAKVAQGAAFVPFDKAQIIPSTPWGWQQPFSIAARVSQAQPGSSFVPFDTVQPVPPPPGFVPYSSFQQPLSILPRVWTAQQGYSFVPLDTKQIVSINTGWLQPLSMAPLIRPRLVGHFHGVGIAPIAPASVAPPWSWQQPLSVAVKVAPAVYEDSTQFAAPVTIPVSGWKFPLSVLPPGAVKAQHGFVWVPFGDVPIAPPPVGGWYRTAANWGVAAPRARAQQGYFFVPLIKPSVPTVTSLAWLMPLGAVPARSAAAAQGASFVPFNTRQITAAPPYGWQQPLSTARMQSAATRQAVYYTQFAIGPPSGAVSGRVKVWNGTAWILKPTKVWTGTAWAQKPVKVWNGTGWV